MNRYATERCSAHLDLGPLVEAGDGLDRHLVETVAHGIHACSSSKLDRARVDEGLDVGRAHPPGDEVAEVDPVGRQRTHGDD